jgi:hypothetical protein
MQGKGRMPWGVLPSLDGDLLNLRTADRYAITILASSGAIWRQIGTCSSPVALGGGNVAIDSKG